MKKYMDNKNFNKIHIVKLCHFSSRLTQSESAKDLHCIICKKGSPWPYHVSQNVVPLNSHRFCKIYDPIPMCSIMVFSNLF